MAVALLAIASITFAGCASDPKFEGFGARPSELLEGINAELAAESIVMPPFEVDGDLKTEGGYKKIFRSKVDGTSIYIYNKNEQDGIRVISNDLSLGEFLKITGAVLDTLESDETAGDLKVKLLIGKAESEKYAYTSGTSVPEGENGISDFSQVKLVFNVSPKTGSAK
ncbi:MAG: hypothetical protein LBC69_01430 [Eubacteriaceae bacterium]|jgi:hypothetical protein|nr:hypothetical protein [Eubacteriaceae bacterium]